MSYMLNLLDAPDIATHVWTPAVDTSVIRISAVVSAHRLAYFRKDEDGKWQVFSPRTGWRVSGNDAEWYDEEIKQGYLVPLDLARQPGFAPKKEVVG